MRREENNSTRVDCSHSISTHFPETSVASCRSKIRKMSRRRSFLSLPRRPLEIDRAIRRFRAFLCKTREGRAFLAKRNSTGKKVERARCIMYSRDFPARRLCRSSPVSFLVILVRQERKDDRLKTHAFWPYREVCVPRCRNGTSKNRVMRMSGETERKREGGGEKRREGGKKASERRSYVTIQNALILNSPWIGPVASRADPYDLNARFPGARFHTLHAHYCFSRFLPPLRVSGEWIIFPWKPSK